MLWILRLLTGLVWKGNLKTTVRNFELYNLKSFLDDQLPSLGVYSDKARGEASNHNMGPGASALSVNITELRLILLSSLSDHFNIYTSYCQRR